LQPQNGVDKGVDAVGIAGLQSGNGKQNSRIPNGAWRAIPIKIGDGHRIGVGRGHLSQGERRLHPQNGVDKADNLAGLGDPAGNGKGNGGIADGYRLRVAVVVSSNSWSGGRGLWPTD
jgi:hypothetical protein